MFLKLTRACNSPFDGWCIVVVAVWLTLFNSPHFHGLSRADDVSVPILRLDAGGHSSYVSDLAWHPNGKELYSASWDKTVRVWRVDDSGRFAGQPAESIRVPIGRGPQGKIDAIAVSSDGRWLAIGGYATLIKQAAGFRTTKSDFRAISSVELLEQGVIYVLDRSNNAFTRLVGHRGPVRQLKFAKSRDGTEHLVSAGFDVDAKQNTIGSLRVWDFQTGKQTAGLLLPVKPEQRPSLAVLASPTAETGLLVMAGWGNERIYHWDTAKTTELRTYADGEYNAVAESPNSKWIVSSSGRKLGNAGQFTFWNMNASGIPSLDSSRTIQFPFQNNEVYLPLAFTLISSVDNGPPDHIAVALCVFSNNAGRIAPDRFQLRVVTVPTRTSGVREVARKDLWQVDASGLLVPNVSTVPGGEYVAVSGNPNHEIQVYRIDALLRNRTDPQRLRSDTLAPRQLTFVQNDDHLGLKISTDAANDTVFDLSNSRISPLPQDRWIANSPATGGWTAVASTTDPRALSVFQNGVLRHALQIPPRHQLSRFTFSAPLRETGRPMVIVAAHEDGQPWLGAFDLGDGELKRVFESHTEPISGMAISGDSRLLATTSSDQTVAIWDISDTGAFLKPRATLANIAMVEDAGRVTVESIQSGAHNVGLLNPGDELTGYFAESQPAVLQPWSSIVALYLSISEREAGSQIKVRRKRGDASSDVLLTLQQAVEPRLPLFQLMMTRGTAEKPTQWIGWSPLGPFDASNKSIQSRLGWHFNEMKPGKPVSFAPIDQYPKLYQPGLIQDSIVNLGKPNEPVPITLQEPRMRLYLIQPQTDFWDNDGGPVVRERPTVAGLQITNLEFATEQIQSIRLRVNDELLEAFTPSTLGRWQIDGLETETWKRGSHLLQAELLTNESPVRSFVTDLAFDYFPPSPIIEMEQPRQLTTKDARMPFNWRVKAGASAEAFEVQLLRSTEDGPRQLLRSWTNSGDQPDAIEFTSDIELMEGKNQFVVTARNSNSIPSSEALESAELEFSIVRTPPNDNPPTIEISQVQQSTLAGFEPVASVDENWLLATQPDIRIAGKISAEEPITTATVDGVPLPGFVRTNEHVFQMDASLNPGINRIRFSAATDVSRAAELELVVKFEQATPEVEMTQPFDDEVITRTIPEAGIDLRAIFEPSAGQRELSAELLLNGQVTAATLAVDMSEGSITGRIPLGFGSNSLQLQLKNDTGATSRTRPQVVYYLPRPEIVGRVVPDKIDGPTFGVQFSGTAATEIERVLVDGRQLAPEQWSFQRQGAEFTLKLTDIPWEGNRAKSVVSMFSAGASTPTNETINVPQRDVQVSPPRVAIISPANNSSVTSETVNIDYQIESLSALFNVEIVHDGLRLKQPVGIGNSFNQQTSLRLRPGLNRIRLIAENIDGMRSELLTLNYVASPVALELKSLTSTADPKDIHRLLRRDNGTWGSEETPKTGSNVLTGSVRWKYRDDASLKNTRLQIWVAVNGFKQPVVLQLPEGDSLERVFECPIQLFRAEDNMIEISAPDLPELSGAKAIAQVDCTSPEFARQRLHLVIIGVGVAQRNEAGLMENAVTSLSGTELRDLKNRKEFVFKSPAFAECIGYGPYVGPVVSREKIGSLLEMIRLRIFQSKLLRPANDVMLVYYRGGEQVYDGGQFYLTTQETKSTGEAEILRNPRQLEHFAVSSNSLSSFVDHCPGTQLLLLDVARTAMVGAQPSSPPDFISGAATFRYAWLKGANVPDDARLISAWQASPMATRLDEIEQSLAERHQSLSQRYRNSVSYENYLPAVLKGLIIGTGQ